MKKTDFGSMYRTAFAFGIGIARAHIHANNGAGAGAGFSLFTGCGENRKNYERSGAL